MSSKIFEMKVAFLHFFLIRDKIGEMAFFRQENAYSDQTSLVFRPNFFPIKSAKEIVRLPT